METDVTLDFDGLNLDNLNLDELNLDLFFKRRSNRRELKGKSLLSTVDDYVVIDIETTGLDPKFDSIIELAAVKYHNDKEIDRFQSLIQPDIEISEFITDLTGITNEMLSTAPTLESGILQQFFDFIGDSVVVGHNVNFDINFLYDTGLMVIDHPLTNDFIDTMRLSRNLFPQEAHHRLCDLIQHFNIAETVEHRALSDVLQTAQCYQYMKTYMQCNDIALHPRGRHYTVRAKDVHARTTEFDIDSPVYQKVFVFTGTLEQMKRKDAMQAVVDLGGICADKVTRKTHFLVLGCNDYCKSIKDGKSTKQKRAEQLQQEGFDITIISENVFYDMLFERSSCASVD